MTGRKSTGSDPENVEPETTEPAVESAEDLEALKAELAKLKKELEERDKGESTDAPKEGKFLIHFIRDGFTMLGKIWYKGQELEFDVDSPAYRDTCNLKGWSPLELRRNPKAQEELYGKVYFREGPWTGKTFADIKLEALKKLASQDDLDGSISVKDLAELEQLDRKRRSIPEPLAPIVGGRPQY